MRRKQIDQLSRKERIALLAKAALKPMENSFYQFFTDRFSRWHLAAILVLGILTMIERVTKNLVIGHAILWGSILLMLEMASRLNQFNPYSHGGFQVFQARVTGVQSNDPEGKLKTPSFSLIAELPKADETMRIFSSEPILIVDPALWIDLAVRIELRIDTQFPEIYWLNVEKYYDDCARHKNLVATRA